jgi:hypothetical protein
VTVQADTNNLPVLRTTYEVSAEQIEHLDQLGWTSLPGLLTPDVVDEIRERLAAGTTRDTYVGPKQGLKSTNLKYNNMALKDPLLRSIVESPRVVSAALGLMRQESAIFGQDVGFNKPAGGSGTPLHQDFPYFPFDRKGGVNLWIALVDMTADMGILHYLEGSHREGPLGFVDPEQGLMDRYPELRGRPIGTVPSLQRGDALAHWDITVHGADGNTTDVTRESWSVQYMRSDTIYTGLKHPHYDTFGLEPGAPMSSHEGFRRLAVGKG